MQCLHSKVMGQPVARGRIAQRLMPRAFSHRSQSLNAVPGLGPNMEALLKTSGCMSLEDLSSVHFDRNHGDATVTKAWLEETVGIKTNSTVQGILSYLTEQNTAPAAAFAGAYAGAMVAGATTSPYDSLVLGVLQNYSGLSGDRLFNMLRNSGRFNESQATLASILRGLAAQGKVTYENNTFRCVSNAKVGSNGLSNGRSPSPAPAAVAPRSPSPPASYRPASPSPAARSPNASNGSGSGASAGDENSVLSVLQNYSGLALDRLFAMLRNSGKYTGTQTSLVTILNGLVSQGKVRDDRGIYRFNTAATRAASPAPAARSASPAPAASYRPASPAPAARSVTPSGPGTGAAAGDQQVVLSVLQNYSGLAIDRLHTMLKNSGKFQGTQSSLSSILTSLISQGRVEDDKGTYRYKPNSGKTPTPARATSPVRGSSYSAPTPSRSPTPSSGSGSGTPSADDAVVLSILQNYAGLTVDRLFAMLRNSGKFKGNQSTLTTVLNGLVSQGRVEQDRQIYRYKTVGKTPTPTRAPSPMPSYRQASPAAPAARSPTPVSGPGAGASSADDAIVLSVLQNYSGLAIDRLFAMLRNQGKFQGTQATLNTILNGLVSNGRVESDRGVYRYKPLGKTPTAARSASPAPAARSSSPAAPAARSPTPVSGPGAGAVSTDQAIVLAVLQNYSGLAIDRLHTMLRNQGKFQGTQSSLNGIVNELVSQGRVENDRGVYRYKPLGKTPTAVRSSSPAARSVSPAAPAARSPTPVSGPGAGAASADDAVVLRVLQNYSGLAIDRLHTMLKNAGNFQGTQSSLSTILNGLVSNGRVENDRGIYRYKPLGKTPTPARSTSPVRSSSPTSYGASTPSSYNSVNSGDETVVLNLLQNYAGLASDRLFTMLRTSGKFRGTSADLTSILSGLVSKGKVKNERAVYRFVSK